VKPRYVLDGDAFATLGEFADHFSRVVLQDYCWHGNLDALNDILRGGFGTPDDGFVLVWHHHAKSRRDLGHVEAARRLERLLSSCHRSNRDSIRQRLDAARRREGPTLFDEIVEIIRDHGEGGEQAADGVELMLE
jgi:RNAse (barnase) inhibitor barstar